jgi:hypothetical protein
LGIACPMQCNAIVWHQILILARIAIIIYITCPKQHATLDSDLVPISLSLIEVASASSDCECLPWYLADWPPSTLVCCLMRS